MKFLKWIGAGLLAVGALLMFFLSRGGRGSLSAGIDAVDDVGGEAKQLNKEATEMASEEIRAASVLEQERDDERLEKAKNAIEAEGSDLLADGSLADIARFNNES